MIAEKFVELFNQYETDLEEVIRIYEAGKDNPPMMRNAPPVSFIDLRSSRAIGSEITLIMGLCLKLSNVTNMDVIHSEHSLN